MSLLGIDVGTTGYKVSAFSQNGDLLASAYEEYDIERRNPGWAELDPVKVWGMLQASLSEIAPQTQSDPVKALCVSSLGEAMVPVAKDRRILGPSLLNFDVRGEEYLEALSGALPNPYLYHINGNTLGNHYSLTKLKWIRDYQTEVYESAFKFLHWASFIAYMMGADPGVDYSLANRTLLFDLDRECWSEELLERADLSAEKLPDPIPSGRIIGAISDRMAHATGLPRDTPIVSGAHDQCANAVGCGVIGAGSAVYGMGTYICITPVFERRHEAGRMIERGLNTEHHAVPGKFVSFIYNQGGALVKWHRDTFASQDHEQAEQQGRDVYRDLFSELPTDRSSVIVLPHFTATGPPRFIDDSRGLIIGLTLETRRGDILKGIIEGATFYLKACVDSLPPTGIEIEQYRPVGGGSKSDAWIQISADILGRPFHRPKITEAGALGAAIMAGVGAGIFASYEEAVDAMVAMERTFDPDPQRTQTYQERYEDYQQLEPLMGDFLRKFSA